MQSAADLFDKIDTRSLECLNQDPKTPISNVLSGAAPEALLCSEDGDAQLLIKLPFLEKVRVAGVRIVPSDAEDDADACPQTIKVFANLMSMGFAEAESEEPFESWELAEDGGEAHAFKHGGSKFRCIDSLQIFVEDSVGNEISKIKHIEVFGQPVDTGEKHWSVKNPSLAYT
eukprot:TRINITY_DN76619_c0_g1_i1.p1 TRINITY_DN76619_c0_g1~~TRINITY_DN76619_c0_g1_i1.p1  ORF type:complete len:195 (+),score=42.16 TRINITY_DN76619_c0_g1_i1:69-587(+)